VRRFLRGFSLYLGNSFGDRALHPDLQSRTIRFNSDELGRDAVPRLQNNSSRDGELLLVQQSRTIRFKGDEPGQNVVRCL
jgi:hypothetical protein